jgi:hypothetical protein
MPGGSIAQSEFVIIRSARRKPYLILMAGYRPATGRRLAGNRPAAGQAAGPWPVRGRITAANHLLTLDLALG